MRRRSLLLSLFGASAFGSKVLVIAGANMLLLLLGVGTGVLAARLLGPGGRGELAAIQMWPGFFGLVIALGLPDALVYFSAREPTQAGRYVGSAVALVLLASLPLAMVAYFALPLLLLAQSAEVVAIARWYLLLLPLTAFVGIPYHALRGIEDFVWWNALRLLPGVGWLGLLLLARMFGFGGSSALALGNLVVLAIAAVPILYVVGHRVQGPFWPEAGKSGPLLRFGLPSLFGNLPQTLNLRLDQMLMAGFLPVQALGLYVVAVAWSGAVSPLVNALGTALFPKLASETGVTKRARIFAQGSRLAILAAFGIATGVMMVTSWVLPLLFGISFAAAIPTARVLVIAAAILSVNGVLEEGLRGLGRPGIVLWAELGGLGATIVFLLLFLRPLGIIGAALASVLAYSIVTIFLVVQACRVTGFGVVAFICPTRLDLSLVWNQLDSIRRK